MILIYDDYFMKKIKKTLVKFLNNDKNLKEPL